MASSRLRLVAACALLWLATAAGALAQDTDPAAAPKPPPPPEVPQPAYDVLRLQEGGLPFSYRVWEEWVPQILATPDGGGWIFFTAQARTADGYSTRRLFATHFDPEKHIWPAAAPIADGGTQFGASPVVDSKGVVHLVYSNRATDAEESWSTLYYIRYADGAWSEPAPVAEHPDAGHQMLASLAIDASDGLHVAWRDQRFVSPEARTALPINADVLASDLVDGAWTEPVQINRREAPDINPAWPLLVADGDRLVVVWSIYHGTTAEEMESAVRVEWSVRPLDDVQAWSAPSTLYERTGGDAGGRLIDLQADPRGGAVAVYGLYNRSNNELFMQRLDSGAEAWSDPILIASGDFGYLPRIAIAGDGTLYVVFNNGRNRDVDIGGLIANADGVGNGAVSLTPAEDGVTARASVSLAQDGTPWVAYMHQPPGSSNVTEIRAVRDPRFTPPVP